MAHRSSVALVTGGSSGLGAAAVAALAEHGARVVNADLVGSSCSGSKDGAVPFVATDVTDPEQVERALDVAEKEYGEPVSLAVNCA